MSWPAGSAVADPHTSHMAEAAHGLSGARQRHIDRVLAVVHEKPGLVASEIAPLAELDVVETRRRLYDLSLADPPQAYRGEARKPYAGGNTQVTWRPAEGQGRLL